jgi:hypothetical protein
MPEPEAVPLASLPDRFGISKQTLYKRLEHLKLPTYKLGKLAFIRSEYLPVLDELDMHLKSGQDMVTFVPSAAAAIVVDESPDVSIETNDVITVDGSRDLSTDFIDHVADALIDRLLERVGSPSDDLLRVFSTLDKVVDRGWLLPTHYVKELIGVRPHGEVYRWGSYEFVRSGKFGRSAAWKVRKRD